MQMLSTMVYPFSHTETSQSERIGMVWRVLGGLGLIIGCTVQAFFILPQTPVSFHAVACMALLVGLMCCCCCTMQCNTQRGVWCMYDTLTCIRIGVPWSYPLLNPLVSRPSSAL
ncbi:MAG: hypothetical protein ACKO37_00170 [Vampirovibrionales bacterium]